MRQLRPSEQGHKGHGEGGKTGEKFLQGAFPTHGEAYEQHEEVDDLVLSKASSHQMHWWLRVSSTPCWVRYCARRTTSANHAVCHHC
jgi:hypothetical protein